MSSSLTYAASLASSSSLILVLIAILSLLSGTSQVAAAGHPDYADALTKAILFFQGQRSGRLPPDQAVTWRSNSGLSDGSAANVDLTGGYYDGGDNVKFGFPMAYTTTMLSWSVLEHGGRMKARVHDARAAVRWGADYLLKAATQTPGKLYVGVGDADADHRCWERPEDMDTPRTVYAVSASAPGSDVAGETAAALAAAALTFRAADPAYARRLLAAARDMMGFAVAHQGKYSDYVGGNVGAYYQSYSGYKDELLWGSAWLLWATKNASYFNYLNSLSANDGVDIFSWDNKLAGARVLLSRRTLVDGDKRFEPFRQQAEDYICRILPNSPSSTTRYTPGGLMHKSGYANLQYVTSASFLLTTYAKYMAVSKHTFSCQSLRVTSKSLRALAKKQVDYILGVNPQGMSYMVNYGARWPQRIHHRASSMPSVASHPAHIGCQEGFQSYFYAGGANPNVHTGAVVGGPDEHDAFSDDRGDYARSEPTTYTNAPLVGCLAYLAGTHRS
ncbi:endoglucanase 11-like isoform X2 [Phragmites australis]|uniref:endoglucanase 11-like isoform X2 n=1 Tax=Phragmites australis TaxID=29695 RepID=UPI002D789DEF|nr:endoglucanase 11-like isoform X2 [Phragmites australis]